MRAAPLTSLLLLALLSHLACGSPNAPTTVATPARVESADSAVTSTPAPLASAAPSTAPSASASLATPAAPAPPSAPAEPPARCPDEMTFVAGGEFKPPWSPRRVTAPDLCVDTTETTARAYAECADAGACTTHHVDCAAQSTFGKPETLDYPMVCVDFAQASAYCEYRQKRLPTIAEWEWAARGGAEARPFPWGDAPPKDQLCWAGAQKQSMACQVGSHPAGDSAHGLKDMSGNVLEFTTTENDAHSDVRIARGGSWRDGAPALVKNSRVGGFGLTYRCAFLGIRCVQEPNPSP